MSLTQLNAISPIDGRYRGKVSDLAKYFSEEALIKYRVKVEIEYFIALCEIPLPQLADFNKDLYPKLREIYTAFSADDAQKIKNIETIFNSFSINTTVKKMNKATEALRKQGINRVPTVIVNGKYQVNRGSVRSEKEFASLVKYLTQKTD